MIRDRLLWRWAAAAFVFVVAFAAHGNALTGAFVEDDIPMILENPWIKDSAHLVDIFFSNTWAFQDFNSNYYRPMAFIMYMVSFHVFGLDALGFHLVNVLLHALVAVMVLLVFDRLLRIQIWPDAGGPDVGNGAVSTVAITAGVLFALNPVHVEPVAWISGISDLLFSLFYLLSFFCYLGWHRDRKPGLLALSLVCFFLSLLSKETALTLPIMLFGFDILMGRSWRLSVAGLWDLAKRYIPFLLVAVLYFALRLYAVGGFAPLQLHRHLSAYECLINVFPLVAQYIGKLLLPIDLSVAYVFKPIASLWAWKGAAALAVVAAYAGAIYGLAVRRQRVAAFSLLWILIPLLPVLYIPALGINVFTERYMYLPSAGFALALSLGLDRLSRVWPVPPRGMGVGLVAALLLAGAYGVGTVQRNMVWHDALSLWSDAVEKAPDGYFTHANLGAAYLERNMTDKAIAAFREAVRLRPDHVTTHYRLGLAYAQNDMLELAAQEFTSVIRLKPEHVNGHVSLGSVYGRMGRINWAIPILKTAVRLDPAHVEAHYNLAVALSKAGRTVEAEGEFRSVLALAPDHDGARRALQSLHAPARPN